MWAMSDKTVQQQRGQERISMEDLARLAGTSKSTVSRVLANRGPISAKMRERVMCVVRQTGFVPDPAASALARRKRGRKGLRHQALALVFCVGDTGFSPFWSETQHGILEAAHESGLAVTTCLVHHHELEQGVPPAAFSRTQFDGILVLPLEGVPPVALKAFGPVVVFGSPHSEDCDLSSVQPDNRAGIRALVGHLWDLGHRRFEYVPQTLARLPFRERREALVAAVAERGGAASVAGPVHDAEAAYAAAFALRPAGERPTALVASEDRTAHAVAAALHERGVEVPRDVSLAGFDGLSGTREYPRVLTTWHVRWGELGRLAVKTLVDLIEGGSGPTRVLVGGNLVVGSSTGPVPAGA